MTGGTLIHGSRRLKRHERAYLLKPVALAVGAVVALGGGEILLLAWSWWQRDSGAGYLCALLLVPILGGVSTIWRRSRPYRDDLAANRVESVVGRVGALAMAPEILPLRLGDRTFEVHGALLAGKKVDEPIMVEYLPHTGLAVAVDGKSNLL